MKSAISLDDLMLFVAVARAGTLSSAAEATGSSPATLSRKMKALEDHVGRRLFLHGGQGYALTTEGRALLERTGRMEAAANDIAQWQARGAARARVRISAGTWTMQHLTNHLSTIWRPDARWVPEIVQSAASLDLARREIDIGIRNHRPTQPWLAGRKTGDRDFAVYGADADVMGYVIVAETAGPTPSQRWVRAQTDAEIVSTVNDPRFLLALARARIGRVVLPCFVGDDAQGLRQLSEPIAELRTEEWLVCHQDARHDPPIRAALEALAQFLTAGPPQAAAP